jgi:hypothetical protein
MIAIVCLFGLVRWFWHISRNFEEYGIQVLGCFCSSVENYFPEYTGNLITRGMQNHFGAGLNQVSMIHDKLLQLDDSSFLQQCRFE